MRAKQCLTQETGESHSTSLEPTGISGEAFHDVGSKLVMHVLFSGLSQQNAFLNPHNVRRVQADEERPG